MQCKFNSILKAERMINVASIQLEWVYTPENYFQSQLSIPFDGGNILIENGIIEAKVDPETFKINQSLTQELDNQIENLFHNEQIKSQKPYDLGMPFKVIVRTDGSRIASPA